VIANHHFKAHFTIILSYRRLRFGPRSDLFVFELFFSFVVSCVLHFWATSGWGKKFAPQFMKHVSVSAAVVI